MSTPPLPPAVPNPNRVPTPVGPPVPTGAPGAPGGVPMPQPVPQPMGAASVAAAGGVPVATVAGAPRSGQATVDEVVGEEALPATSFWQIPFVQDVLPFLTSLLLHIGIIALGLLAFKTAQIIVQVSKEPVVIPDAVIVEGAEVGGIPHPGLGGDDSKDAAQNQFEVPPDTTGIAEKPSTSLTQALTGGGDGETDESLIATGLQSGAFGKGSGVGSGVGKGLGSGTGDGGGALAPFGIPGGGGGMGPKSPFMGVSGNAMKVVYLCDSSGSMMNKFDTLRMELRKAVDSLKPSQEFDILFFSEDKYLALDKQLLYAVPEVKRKAYEFLDKTAPHGSSDPIPGLRAAFATKPQLIYMLTDGDFPNAAAALEEIRKLNPDKKVKINTIAFMDRGEEYEKFLKQVATENGGLFKFVSGDDLK